MARKEHLIDPPVKYTFLMGNAGDQEKHFTEHQRYLTVILRGRAGYELIYITNEAVGRVGYYQLLFFSDVQNFSARNSPSVFPYLVKLNDNGSYDGLREPIRKLENHYPELKIY